MDGPTVNHRDNSNIIIKIRSYYIDFVVADSKMVLFMKGKAMDYQCDYNSTSIGRLSWRNRYSLKNVPRQA